MRKRNYTAYKKVTEFLAKNPKIAVTDALKKCGVTHSNYYRQKGLFAKDNAPTKPVTKIKRKYEKVVATENVRDDAKAVVVVCQADQLRKILGGIL